MNRHYNIDASKILTRAEITTVLIDLNRRAKRSVNSRMNLTIFRLATCCGLRSSEISGLKLQDVGIGIERPYLYLPSTITKGKKSRLVPLCWDTGTLKDISIWKANREQQGANQDDYFVCTLSKSAFGKRLKKSNIRHRFQIACRALGKDRLFIGQDQTKTGRKYNKHLTVHHGRHSFCSHALAGGRTLTEVRDAAGHSDISTTSIYLHVVTDGDEPGDIFDFNKKQSDYQSKEPTFTVIQL